MATTDQLQTADRDPGAVLEGRRIRLEPYDVGVGPLGHIHEERQRLAALRWEHFEARPQGATVGAVISGCRLSGELPDSVISELRRALLDYKVLLFRDQSLSAAEHLAFAGRFGELETHPFIPPNPEHPELVRFEKSADVGGYENGWHSDVSWRECPSLGAILHAIDVPPTGGDTLFSDMGAAYDGLEAGLQARIDGLVAVHDYARAFGHQVSDEDKQQMRERFPAVEHPVVRTHPETGRKLLYVNRFFVDHIVGLGPDESTALIDLLSKQAELPEYQCRFQWEAGSVAFWDNRAVQHYAASDYWPDVRVMERASIVGDRPR